MSEIKKGDTLKLKQWIINLINNTDEFYYAQLSVYEDYEYVDQVVYLILKEFSDFIEGVSNCKRIETIATDINNKLIESDLNIKIFNGIKNIFGREGYIVFFEYGNKEALWHSGIKYFKTENEAQEYRNFIIKMEIAGIESKIEELLEMKSKLQLSLENKL